MTSGIYEIVGPRSMRYVGQSSKVDRRLKEHRAALRKGAHDNPRLQHAWNKHGESAFSFVPLAFVPIEWLTEAEQAALDGVPIEHRYNMGACVDAPARGLKRSVETIARLKARPISDETRKRISDSRRGHKLSEEHKLRISTTLKGRKFSDETRAKISAAKMGHEVSEKTKQAVAAAGRNRIASEETRQKRRVYMTGRKLSAETRAKIAQNNRIRWKSKTLELF